MQKIASYIQESFYNIYQFNDLAGNLEDVKPNSIAAQLDFIQEEYLETVEAFDLKDDKELLDGAIDIFVTSVGLLQKLEAAGFNVKEAMQRVDQNNLSKFLRYDQEVMDNKHFKWTMKFNDKYQRWVLKDALGKVKKPLNFKPVEIGDCAVAGFLATEEVV